MEKFTFVKEEIMYTLYLAQKLGQWFWYKVVLGFFVSLPLLLFDDGLSEAMMALLLLIVFDLITGVIASKKTGKEIKSAHVFQTALKTFIYFMMISAAHLTFVAGLPFKIDVILVGFLAVTELVSILENVGRMGYVVPQKLLNQLKEYKRSK